jgi:GAF domain-containing protein
MTHKLTHKQFRQMVEEQGQALLDALALAAHGSLDVHIDIPEGIDVLTDLAIGFDFLLDDLRVLVQKQEAAQELLEQRVAERTRELEEALAEVQAVQRRYIEHEWTDYAADMIIGDVDLPESWEPVLETAVSRQQAITRTNGESTLALPVQYGDEVIGVMGFGGDVDETDWDDNDLAAVEAIAEQVGLALENQRLFDQTQAALNESSSLYEASAKLNAAETIEDILETLYQYSILGENSHHISLNFFDVPWTKRRRADAIEVLARKSSLPEAVLRTSYKIEEFPDFDTFLKPDAPAIFTDVDTAKIDDNIRMLYKQVFKAESAIFVPLSIGNQWLGFVNAYYDTKRTFSEADVNRVMALAGQAAVAVSNKRLLADTQEHAAQLETLALVEVALSQANSEQEILQALMQGFDLKGISGIELNYLSHQPDNSILLDGYGFWANGRFLPDDVLTRTRGIDLKSSPITSLWENNPNTITYVEDITKDERGNDQVRQHAQEQNWQAAAIMPLRRGGDVLAMVWIAWENAHPFTDAEKFLLARLLEPVSAVVSSRRAQLAQQEALAETASLYRASAEMNAAQTYDSILSVVRKYTTVGRHAHSINFNLFEHPWTSGQTPEWTTILASYSKQQQENEGLPSRYSLAQFASVRKLLRADEPVIIEDFDNPPTEIDEATYNLYVNHYGAKSAVFAPLVVGGQWIGFINAQFKEKIALTESHIRRLASIAGQAAVAIQNIALLEQTRAKAQREQMLREITARVRGSADVDTIMKTAVQDIGRALGRKTYIYLDSGTTDEDPAPAAPVKKNGA